MVNRKNLTDAQHIRLKYYLLERLANGKLPRGILKAAAVKFSFTWQMWHVTRALSLNGEWDVTSGKKGSDCGLKYNHDKCRKCLSYFKNWI
jgi:hypothetical protein